MADSLSLLRNYNLEGKLSSIEERDDQIIFGEFSWPRNSLTNFIKYRLVYRFKLLLEIHFLIYGLITVLEAKKKSTTP